MGFAQLNAPTAGRVFLSFFLFLLELLFELAFDLFLIKRFQHFLQFRIVSDIHAQFFQNLGQDFEDFGIFLLGDDINLQAHLLAQAADLFLPVLGDQNEDRENDRLQGDGSGKEDVRIGVKRLQPWAHPRIEN